MLNARYHEQEAYIIAQAGRPGAVTIATNMAGRGTDIQLGGNLEMRLKTELAPIEDAGRARASRRRDPRRDRGRARGWCARPAGSSSIGSERHESRRIDNQLRGRSGRQGDPGASKFFVSLEDDLMRIFGSERMDSMLQRLGLKEGEAIIHPWVNKALAKAQQKVEARNYDIRKQLLKYDDVMNDQRKVVYEQRREIMNAARRRRDDRRYAHRDDRRDRRARDPGELAARAVGHRRRCTPSACASWRSTCRSPNGPRRRASTGDESRSASPPRPTARWPRKSANYGPDLMRMAEKSLLLQFLDQIWKDHLLQLDHLRQGINLRAYAQRDPLNEYKREAFELFEAMLANLREQVTGRAQPSRNAHGRAARTRAASVRRIVLFRGVSPRTGGGVGRGRSAAAATGRRRRARRARRRESGRAAACRRARMCASGTAAPRAPWAGTGRNAPCPCGSGRKYKHCHGRI